MEAMEAQVHGNELENKLKQRLLEARSDETEKNQADNSDSVKPQLDLNLDSVKSVYKVKKLAQLKILSRNVPESIKPKLSHLAKVEDREAEIVKRVFDRYGSDNLSPEMIELINKYINTPIWPLIEMEFELNEKMKADILAIVESEKGEK